MDIMIHFFQNYFPLLVIVYTSNTLTDCTKVAVKDLLDKSITRTTLIMAVSVLWSGVLYAGYAFFAKFDYIEMLIVLSLTPLAYRIRWYQRMVNYSSDWLTNKGATDDSLN